MINIVSFRPKARFSAIYNGSGKGAGVHFRSNDSLIAIAGLGTETKFTAWIEDLYDFRVSILLVAHDG